MNLNNIYITHRGYHNKYNENTYEAFKKSIVNNLPFELDIHLTKDNIIVISHDNNLKRTTRKNIDISKSNYNDIKDIKIINTSQNIPKLKDILDLTKGKVLIDIEIKKDNKNFKLEKELIKLLSTYNGQFIIKSFDILSLLYLKIRTNYTIGILMNKKSNDRLLKKILDNFVLSFIKFDFYCLSLAMLPCPKVSRKGKPILVWTIDSLEKLEKAKYLANSYIIENIF